MGCGPAGGLPAFDPWVYQRPVYQAAPRPAPVRPAPVVVKPAPPAVRPVVVPPPESLGVKLEVPPVEVPPPGELGIELK